MADSRSSRALRVLVVDDDPAMARLVRGILGATGFGEVLIAASAREALDALGSADVVLLDHHLPDASGLDVLDAVRARPNAPPVVMVTAHGNEGLAATALRRGADDYLAKDASLPELLPQILERVRRTRELRKALAAAERDLVRVERLGAIGEMTVTLHHEVNNPLMSALADVQLLLAEGGGTPDRLCETLRSIERSLRRIGAIVQRIGDLRDVRTRRYVQGIAMVDLDGGGEPASSVHRGTALLSLADEDLARIVSLLLRHVGFAVQRHEPSALAAAAAGPSVALIVLAGGTDAGGAHPLGGFDPAPARSYRVVALVTGDGSDALAAGADRIVQLPFDPGDFTTDLIDLADRR